jgi:hypothetical protein
MSGVTVQDGQTLRDICIQVYGDLDMLFELAIENDLPSLTPQLPSGTVLKYDEVKVVNSTVVKYFAKNRITCASEISDETAIELGIFDETFDSTYN